MVNCLIYACTLPDPGLLGSVRARTRKFSAVGRPLVSFKAFYCRNGTGAADGPSKMSRSRHSPWSHPIGSPFSTCRVPFLSILNFIDSPLKIDINKLPYGLVSK